MNKFLCKYTTGHCFWIGQGFILLHVHVLVVTCIPVLFYSEPVLLSDTFGTTQNPSAI